MATVLCSELYSDSFLPFASKLYTNRVIITVDGMAASGKSSVSSGVARALGIPYVSSGLLYRAVTWLHEQAGQTVFSPELCSGIRLEPLPEGNKLWHHQTDVTAQLHSSEVDERVSFWAAQPVVRAWVDAQLRRLSPPFVAEGRDMGTNVFPDANAKFYLVASARIRAERRCLERPEDVDAIEAALTERDQKDRTQSVPAPDAIQIDTGTLDLQGVIDAVLRGCPDSMPSL